MSSPFNMDVYPKNVAEALESAMCGMSTDGAHHKQWYLDQIVRALTREMYESCVQDFEQKFGRGSWDAGIAP